MKQQGLLFAILLWSVQALAQEKVMMAFPITDYILEKDSVSIVQVLLPEGIEVKVKAPGVLKKAYQPNDTSTMMIGTGRCQLIKGQYLYYGLLQKGLKQKPVAGNLMYTQVLVPGVFTGNLFNVIRHGITLQDVEGQTIAGITEVLRIRSKQEEQVTLEKLAADVRYTGLEMSKQGGADMTITSGIYSGKTVFGCMQATNVSQVEQFLEYIIARPDKYAGNTWKFSEIMATWMFNGAPTVIK